MVLSLQWNPCSLWDSTTTREKIGSVRPNQLTFLTGIIPGPIWVRTGFRDFTTFGVIPPVPFSKSLGETKRSGETGLGISPKGLPQAEKNWQGTGFYRATRPITFKWPNLPGDIRRFWKVLSRRGFCKIGGDCGLFARVTPVFKGGAHLCWKTQIFWRYLGEHSLREGEHI